MKVSILTIIGIENYGSLLQAIATQNKMEEYADNVEFINFVHNSRFRDLTRNQKNPIRILFRILRTILYNKNYRKIKNKHINLSNEIYTCKQDFIDFKNNADIYCTGSDQIWNPTCIRRVPLDLRFLSFAPDGKRRFAFASSFGIERMDDDIVTKSKDLVNQFEYISVREDYGVKILKEQYGYENAVQLVDPTLAMPLEFWKQYVNDKKKKSEYIFIYTINANKSFDNYAKKLSKITNLPLIRLCPDFNQLLRCGRSILIPPVFRFISLIDNAKYVLTDSLHATAFSMIMHTTPICVCQDNPGRLISFLRLIDQESSVISGFDDFDVINRTVDFNHVDKVLENERKRVDDFLSKVFQKHDKSC